MNKDVTSSVDATPPTENSNSSETYFIQRDAEEQQRLNIQHHLFVDLCKGILQPSVGPAPALENIADVGTGTGIWLHELANKLESTPTASGNPRHFTGFDLSTLMFPKDSREGFKFAQHDMRNPFPFSEQGKYDLVHARLLAGAFKDDVKPVVQNMLGLLKPGGFLQWEDVDIGARFGPETGSKVLVQARDITHDFIAQQGNLRHLPPVLGRELRAHQDVESVSQTEYDSHARRDLKAKINEVYFDAVKLVLGIVQKKCEKHRDLDVDKLMQEMEKEFEEKDLILGDVCTVFVARKKMGGK